MYNTILIIYIKKKLFRKFTYVLHVSISEIFYTLSIHVPSFQQPF